MSSGYPTDEVIKRFISNHVPVENQNWGISQNPVNGYIYFANSEGLIEFNGISSRLFNSAIQKNHKICPHFAGWNNIYRFI